MPLMNRMCWHLVLLNYYCADQICPQLILHGFFPIEHVHSGNVRILPALGSDNIPVESKERNKMKMKNHKINDKHVQSQNKSNFKKKHTVYSDAKAYQRYSSRVCAVEKETHILLIQFECINIYVRKTRTVAIDFVKLTNYSVERYQNKILFTFCRRHSLVLIFFFINNKLFAIVTDDKRNNNKMSQTIKNFFLQNQQRKISKLHF